MGILWNPRISLRLRVVPWLIARLITDFVNSSSHLLPAGQANDLKGLQRFPHKGSLRLRELPAGAGYKALVMQPMIHRKDSGGHLYL